jgi:hypothetical protein
VPLDTLEGSAIQSPTIASALAAGSAEVEDGGALVLAQDWNTQGAWLVRVRGGGPAPGPDVPWVPLGGLGAKPLVPLAPPIASPAPSGGFAEPERFGQQLRERDEEPALSTSAVIDFLGRAQEDAALRGPMIAVDGALWCGAPGPLLDLVRERVRAWDAEHGGTVAVEVRLGLVPRTSDVGVADLPQRMTGAVCPGDALLLVGGSERFYLQDHDVEIADSSFVADPVQRTLFDGVSRWCRAARARDGRLSLAVELEVQELLGEPARIDVIFPPAIEGHGSHDGGSGRRPPTGPPRNAPIELPHTTRTGVRTRLSVVAGDWTQLARMPLPGTDRELRAVIRATPVGG